MRKVFKSNAGAVKREIAKGCGKILENSSELILSRVKENTAVKTGKTRRGWVRFISYGGKRAVIGNVYKNALWEEFGTGEYTVNGRKGGWVYKNEYGEFIFTKGKPPKRAFQRAYNQCEGKVILMAEKTFKEGLK